MIFKCKMCGGELTFDSGASIAVCPYCGTKQTLPKLNRMGRADQYERANNYRMHNDYDNALMLYERILQEDSTDAEAYWSIVTCRYGIQYVTDPYTDKKVATINRMQNTDIREDADYQKALQYADDKQRAIYEADAVYIERVRKKIKQIADKETPYSVFICYKESDDKGERTQDSVTAVDIQQRLEREGIHTFCAHVSLEDKIGNAYEPYIFAALNSAQAMVVLGSRPEYLEAVWVRNEWSRYLNMVRNGQQKTIIPVCLGMNPGDLPKEFKHIQAVDFTRVGAMQDLILGLKKIVTPERTKRTDYRTLNTKNEVWQLLERTLLAFETDDWIGADQFCEQALNKDAHCGMAYLYKLFCENHVHDINELVKLGKPIDKSINYKRAVQFSENLLKEQLTQCSLQINNEIKCNKRREILADISALRRIAHTVSDICKIKELYAKLLPSDEIQKIIDEINQQITHIETDVKMYEHAQKKNIWMILLTPIVALMCLSLFNGLVIIKTSFTATITMILCIAPFAIEALVITKYMRNSTEKKQLITDTVKYEDIDAIKEKINAMNRI